MAGIDTITSPENEGHNSDSHCNFVNDSTVCNRNLDVDVVETRPSCSETYSYAHVDVENDSVTFQKSKIDLRDLCSYKFGNTEGSSNFFDENNFHSLAPQDPHFDESYGTTASDYGQLDLTDSRKWLSYNRDDCAYQHIQLPSSRDDEEYHEYQ